MVRMQWVEGRTLDEYVGHLVAAGDVPAIGALAGTWRDLVRRMQTARFAHGDLQHGNVLIDTRGTLRLVDLDYVCGSPTSRASPHRPSAGIATTSGQTRAGVPGCTPSRGW
ncbi:MAG: hypothetical protein M3Z25_04470 [Actinomycetota bacterium]|nr:hypothetical protein [Actinomycetota bacterium]